MNARTAVETDFLPGALAIRERPPSPVGRAVLWVIVSFFVVAVLWAVFGRVDIVAIATGRIVPGDRVKQVQPLEKGVVQRIWVEEGERVTAGQPLLDLDATINRAGLQQIGQELGALRLEAARLALLAAWLSDGRPEEDEESLYIKRLKETYEEEYPDRHSPEVHSPVAMLTSEWRAFQARRDQLNEQAAARRAELRALSARIDKLRAILPLVQRRTEGARKLVDRELLPEHRWLELEQERIDTTQSLAEAEAGRDRVRARIAATDAERNAHLASTQTDVATRLHDVRERIAQREQDLVKARRMERLHVLRAPVAGMVQDLTVHTEGAVVTPAETLMRIVPVEDSLTVEAWITNRDIGFVAEGQACEVKVDAFPFTKYGTIPCRITHVSDDATPDEKRGLVFRALVDLDRDVIAVDGRQVRLTPGMQVSVEARTGERRLIEYLLSPLLRYRQESLRER